MKGNVPNAIGAGIRQYAGILEVTDLLGNNLLSITSSNIALGNGLHVGSAPVTIFTNQNSAGNAALAINNLNNTSNNISSINFLAASVLKNAITSDFSGNLTYTNIAFGSHKFVVPNVGNSGASGTALQVNPAGIVSIADPAGNLTPAGYRGFPLTVVTSSSYTTQQSDAGKCVFFQVTSNSTCTLGATLQYLNGDFLMVMNTDSAQNITVQAASGENLIYAGVTASRVLGQAGSLIAMKVSAGNWIITGGVNFT